MLRKYAEVQMRLACDRCKELEARGNEIPAWAKEWWSIHKKIDKEQQERDEQTRRSNNVRQQAIEKLTPEERNELGV